MISTNFINECKNRANANRLGKIIVDGIDTPITNSDNLQSFEIDSGCYVDGNIIGSVYAKCLKANFIAGQNNLNDKSVYAQIGVKYADLSNEYINMGKYIVERPNNEITAKYSQITAYDNLYTNLDSKYVCNIDYSTGDKTLADLYIDVCTNLGLTPKSLEFINSTIPIVANPFTNGEKNRTVLQTIAKISCSFVDIENDTNKIDLCWLSQNEEPDYIFYENDYSSVEGGQVVCGPINCLIIKNSQVDDENVTIKDEDSIALYGEHSMIISEDYILHNAELRQQAINSIWDRVKGMKYVDCKLITYYGKPFLKLGYKIRVYTSNTEYFDTYVLKHKFTYDGSFTSVIESPALTEQEIKTKQDISLGQKLVNVQIDVNKQKEEINLLSKKVVDTTETKNGVGLITINSKLNNPGYKLIIKNACQLFPSKNLFPSNSLFPLGRWLRVTYEDSTYNRYKLPVLALRQLNNIYDELIIECGKVQNIKRIGIKEDGSLYLLNIPITTTYEDVNIILKSGINKIQLESFPNANLEIQYMIDSIYSNTFSTKVETNAEIKVATDEINLEVAKKTDKEKIINTINMSSEKTKINVNKLDVDAIATFTNSKLKEAGSTVINGSNITTGDIDGNNVNVKNINADNITSGNIKSANYVKDVSGTEINLTDGSIDTKNCKIDANGTATLKNISIQSGQIKLEDDGSIGNSQLILSTTGSDINKCIQSSRGIWLFDQYSSGDAKSSSININTLLQGVPMIVLTNWNTGISSMLRHNLFKISDGTNETVINSSSVTSPTITQTSLKSIKKNLKKFQNGLSLITNADIYTYNLKSESNTDKKHIGLIIGDKYNTPNEVISKDEQGIDLYAMISVAWQSIKELNKRIEQLEETIKKMESDK